MASKRSAGIVLYRPAASSADRWEVLLVHPGGPFWANKESHAWSIPKGEIDDGEDPSVTARREFVEELGLPLPTGEYSELGIVSAPRAKKVLAWAVRGDLDPALVRSNETEIEWPPRSGRTITIPEIDRAAWFPLDQAAAALHKGQSPVVAALERHVSSSRS